MSSLLVTKIGSDLPANFLMSGTLDLFQSRVATKHRLSTRELLIEALNLKSRLKLRTSI